MGDIEAGRVGQPLATMYADYRCRFTVNGKSVKDTINDHDWNVTPSCLPWASVAPPSSPLAVCRRLRSAANAAIDHMRDWALGTNGKWVTMGIPSRANTAFLPVMFGYPVTCENGEYKIVEGLEIDAFSQRCIQQDPG